MNLGWIEGLKVSLVCKEQDASSPNEKISYLLLLLCTYVFLCVCAWKLWRGVCGIISAAKASLGTSSV